MPTALSKVMRRTDLGLSTGDIMRALHTRYSGEGWVFFEELRMGVSWTYGHAWPNEQRIDAWAIHTWRSKKFRRVAFEIKRSRSDFQREMANPSKREAGYAISNYFYFVCPEYLIGPAEVPDGDGLLWVKRNGNIREAVRPKRREPPMPPWDFFAMLCRRSLIPQVQYVDQHRDGTEDQA